MKARETIGFSEKHPIKGNAQVDDFVLGGYKQGKISRSYNEAITVVELTEQH